MYKRQWLYRICIGFVVMLVVVYIGYVLRSGGWRNNRYEISCFYKKQTRKEMIFWAFIIGLIFYQVFYVVYFQHADSDEDVYKRQIQTRKERHLFHRTGLFSTGHTGWYGAWRLRSLSEIFPEDVPFDKQFSEDMCLE